MTIKETKLCRQCGKEYSTKEFVTNWRNGTTTYTCCKACRKELYKRKANERAAMKAEDMMWYQWWPLRNTIYGK